MIYRKSLLLSACLFLTIGLFAQQTSKTKAANKLYEKGGEVQVVKPKPINTPKVEFSPTFYQNGIVYIRSTQKTKETLYFSELDANGNPLAPQEFAMDIPFHLKNGSVTFDRSGKTMFFTSNAPKTNARMGKVKGQLKIYQFQRDEKGWSQQGALPFNSDDYDCAYPSLSADGQRLYFSSNMPGGQGGMDLYVAKLTDGQWGPPENLGKKINTSKSEIFPFIHSTGNLFFASNGHPGAGGFDLYMMDDNKARKTVTNLGESFNTAMDETSLIINPDGTEGYFTSNRSESGLGGKDIFLFTVENGIWGRTGASEIATTLDIYSSLTGVKIEGAEVRIFERQEPLATKRKEDLFAGVLVSSDDGKSLRFAFVRKNQDQTDEDVLQSNKKGIVEPEFIGERKYLLLVSKEGYRSREIAYSTERNQGKEKLSIWLEPVECANLSGQVRHEKEGTPLADAIIKIKNTCDGAEQFILTDEAGRFGVCLPTGCTYVVIASKDKYRSHKIVLDEIDPATPIKQEWNLAPTQKKRLKDGAVIILEKINYDFGKSFIREGHARELDELFFLLEKHPEMIVELSAHTDARGEDAYNQRLSRQRAESIKAYLVARGIATDRIIAVGYGENQIRNRCRDGARCTDAEHAVNNRIEVKVIRE